MRILFGEKYSYLYILVDWFVKVNMNGDRILGEGFFLSFVDLSVIK